MNTLCRLYPERDFFFQSAAVTVYLIHLNAPVGRSQHYIGSTTNLDRRLRQHRYKRKKGGSPLLREANKRGILWDVAKTWQASRDFEMFLKRQKNARRYCPLCHDVPFYD
jgi:predicted GIY-YIG superfamily endonuclease